MRKLVRAIGSIVATSSLFGGLMTVMSYSAAV